MALVDHDSWDIEYEGCERLRHQLLVQLHQRQQLGPAATLTRDYIQLNGSLKLGLEQLEKDVKHLKVVLDNAITWETSPEEELQQRRIDFDKLTSQCREIQLKFAQTTQGSAYSSSASSSSVWQDQQTKPPVVDRPTDVATLKLRQAEMLENQERGLEILSATISRQRNLATQLGTEVEDQNNILDNLANTMDRVESGVSRETQQISQVNRRDSTWGYWLVIIALFVSIIVVIFAL